MTGLLDTLRTLSRSDLVDLLHVLVGHETFEETDGAESLARQTVAELRRLCALPASSDAELERYLMRRVANTLGVDYDPVMDVQEITARLRDFITDTIVEDLRPFIRVAVCMGWADGTLKPEEIAVVDAALSRLKLLVRRRSELLRLCRAPIRPGDLADELHAAAADDQKAWSLLALGWAVALADLRTHPQEVRAFHELAGYLGIPPERAERLRQLVTKRFRDTLEVSGVSADRPPSAPRALAKATMGAITAAELDDYLQAKVGLKALSLLLSSPVRVREHRDSLGMVNEVLGHHGWVGAPTLLAGTLFLRRVGPDPATRKLLVTVLLCLERQR
jgi:tellurite resistance protein